ncbi:MAG TPA: hypothetical protein VGK73_10875 [Polyangiaceae bacterium]
MNDTEPGPDLFTEALKLDLPSERDEARVRRRLMSAGLLAGASVVAPGAVSAAASGGVFAKLAALPLALKIGASAVVVGVAALPVVQHAASGGSEDAAPRAREVQVAAVAAPAGAREARENAVEPAVEALLEPGVPPVEPAPKLAVPARALVRPVAETSRQPSVVPALQATTEAALPAVGSFQPTEAAPVDEGTLRAETLLLEKALSAIQRGDLATARRELAAHAAKFPNGHLRPERERALERTLGKETEQ